MASINHSFMFSYQNGLYVCWEATFHAVSLVSIGHLAQGEAGLCRNATCAFRPRSWPSRWVIGESALSPDASEEGAIDFVGVASVAMVDD